MRKFMINVNGKSYEVEVEEVGGAPATNYSAPAAVAAPATPAPAPAAAPAPAPAAPKATASGSEGSVKISAPMPGTILRIAANVGDKVTAGQPIVVLEAMKMENDIVAPSDGVVSSINVTSGQSVNSGDVIATLA